MFISAPIPHLAIMMSVEFQDSNDTKRCVDILDGISTNNVQSGVKTLDDIFVEFTSYLKENKGIQFFTANTLYVYFNTIKNNELSDLFHKLIQEKQTYITKDDNFVKHSRYLTGLVTSALLSDSSFNKNDFSVPEHVQTAVDYIESEGFLVHLEQKDD